jgi:hypothetical protein
MLREGLNRFSEQATNGFRAKLQGSIIPLGAASHAA